MAAPERRDRRSARTDVAPRRVQPPLPGRRPQHRTSATYRPTPRRVVRRSRTPGWLTVLALVGLFVLAALAMLVGPGLVTRGASSLASTLGGLIANALPSASGGTASPSSTLLAAPRLATPRDPYTNKGTWDLSGTLSSDTLGMSGLRLQVYVNGNVVETVDAPSTLDFTIPAVPLAEGTNELTVSVVSPNGASPPSASIQVQYDATPPKITLGSPKEGAVVATATVLVKGATQAGSSVTIHDDLSGATTTVIATSGAFQTNLPLGDGLNTLTLTATDPAGNTSTSTVHVKHTGAALTASLTLSARSIRSGASAVPMTMTVTVLDGAGHPVAGAQAIFSFGPPPGGQSISGPILTDANGKASWTQTVPQGTPPGQGLVTVQVTTTDGRVASASQTFTVGP